MSYRTVFPYFFITSVASTIAAVIDIKVKSSFYRSKKCHFDSQNQYEKHNNEDKSAMLPV